MSYVRTKTGLPSLDDRLSLQDVERQAAHFNLTSPVRVMLDTLPDLLMVVNEHRQIIYANRAMSAYLQQESIGLRPGEALDCLHSDETPGGCGTSEFCPTCGAARALVSGLSGYETVEECRIALKDGGALDLRVWTSPLTVDSDRYTVVGAQDISDEKRRLALERIFLHDLLNVVGGVVGYAALLPDADEQSRDFLAEMVVQFAGRVAEEIRSQQLLLEAENRELAVKLQPIESLALLQEAASLYAHHDVSRERSIVIDPQAESFAFTSDLRLVKRVVGNMVKNALEAAPPGGAVTLSCCLEDDDMVAFSVRNPGVMPRDVQLQVFQRSFSTKGAGRGLGTYAMRLLSEQYLDGGVSFTTSRSSGTTFTARYPRVLVPS